MLHAEVPRVGFDREGTTVTISLALLLGSLVVIMLPPLGMVLYGSLTDTPPGAPAHFTFSTIVRAYSDRHIYPALLNSLLYAAATSTLVLLIGGFLAWIVERTDSTLGRLAGMFALAPILMPAVLLVSGWILLLDPRNGIVNMIATQVFGMSQPPFSIYTFGGMIWVGTLQELPLAFLWLSPAFRSMNPELEDAATIAGAGGFTVVRRITLPVLRPAIRGAWAIFFIYSLGALSVPLLLGMPGGIFLYSTEVYLATSQTPTDYNLAGAYSLLLVATTIIGIHVYRRSIADTGRFVTITSRGYRPRLINVGRWRPVITCFGVVILLLVAGLPLLVLIWNSFLPYPQAPSWRSLEILTLRNYGLAFNYGPAKRAVVNSVILGVTAGFIATFLGALVAWASVRLASRSRLVGWIDQLATLPIAIPGLIVGVGLLWMALISPVRLYGTRWILLIAYVILHLPYAVRICASGLSQIHRELEEAAFVSGASWATVFRRITLMLLAPSFIGSIVYVALRSFREYTASIFLIAPGTEVFSVLVLDMWEEGNSSVLSAYVTMVVALLALTILLLHRLGRRVGIRV